MSNKTKLPKLPIPISRKIYKTGQTRGADDDVIYQNRVGRNSTVLIPYHQWINDSTLREAALEGKFEKGYIVLISPNDYFKASEKLESSYNLVLGENLLVFYETRDDWNQFNPDSRGLTVATSRVAPLCGDYVARVPGTTSKDDFTSSKIQRGFNSKNQKGAGIRLYEYSSLETINQCRLQLEAIFWLCYDSDEVCLDSGMSQEDIKIRKDEILQSAQENGLLDFPKLREMRILNENNRTICPLCLEEISAVGFIDKIAVPLGREVPDLTVTQVSLFHIDELKYGQFNHKPYNLGWGHHFCNVVVKDSGIDNTIEWMKSVLARNDKFDKSS